MSWLFAVKRYQSEKNGLIVCRKFFGPWEVFVDGYYQSAPYIKKMWRLALRRLPRPLPVSRILVLGLGAGSIIDDLAQKYPGATTTVIEYDPVMVEISKELKLFNSEPNIIVDDAIRAVPSLEGTFDLIIVDLYRGGKTAEILERPEFIQSIAAKLSPNGQLILNAFTNLPLFPLFDKYFTRQQHWVFRFNALALYKKLQTEA